MEDGEEGWMEGGDGKVNGYSIRKFCDEFEYIKKRNIILSAMR